jgi:hypothetical protein
MGDKVRSEYPASPGFGGALKDAISSVADAVAPRGVRPSNRKKQLQEAESEDYNLDRYRQNQHSPGN